MTKTIVAIVAAALAALCVESFADVPADLVKLVENQKKNKSQVAKTLQQQSVIARQRKDIEYAKKLKNEADGVRENRFLYMPKFGENGSEIGTIQVEKVIEKFDEGVRIATSLPRLEQRGGVNVRTGAAVTSPFLGTEYIWYPEKIDVLTAGELKTGETIVIRLVKERYEQVPAEQIAEATAMLRPAKSATSEAIKTDSE
jgi:hypothetical protein